MTSSEAMATALANGFPPKVLRVMNNKRSVSSQIIYPNSNTKKMADLKWKKKILKIVKIKLMENGKQL